MKKTFGGFSIALLLLGLCLCLASVIQSVNVPDLLEYSALAHSNACEGGGQMYNAYDPDAQGNGAASAMSATALYDQITRMDELWEEIDPVVSARTVWGYTASAQVAEESVSANAATASVYTIAPGYASVYPMLALSGRLMFEDELKYGDPVALVDEALAMKLFASNDAVDKQVVVNNQTYRVVGTVQGKRAMGDPAEFRLYLPLMAVARGAALDVDQLTVGTAPMPASGAYETMADVIGQWDNNGTLNDTRREREMVLLGLRWVSGFLAMAVIVWVLKKHVALGKDWVDRMRARLKEQYMIRLFPGVAWRAIVWALGLAALAACVYIVFTFIVQPVLIFPEWVPAVPVEIESIYSTFWSLQWTNNSLMELRTPAILRLRHFGTMANVGLCVCLLGLILGLARGRRKA